MSGVCRGTAMLNEPDILILDEPTSGLDPGERVRFSNLLSEFTRNRIVMISTHIVSDVEYIANRNAILKNGQIVNAGTTEELIATMRGNVYTATIPAAELPKYERNTHIVNVRSESNGDASLRYIASDANIPNSASVEPRLEDLYLWLFRDKITGKEAAE